MTKNSISPLKQIRRHCLECQGDSVKAVRLCPMVDCNLWRLRMGCKPKRSGDMVRYYDEKNFVEGGVFYPDLPVDSVDEK